MANDLELKKKINRLLEYIEQMQESQNQKLVKIELLKQEIDLLLNKEKTTEQQEKEVNGKYLGFIEDFCRIASSIVTEEKFIPYRYATKFSKDYYKVEKDVWEDLICDKSKIDLRTFLNYCVDLGIVKSEGKGRVLYNSGPIRVYYISKMLVDATLTENFPSESMRAAMG